jgi:hypothetical protein
MQLPEPITYKAVAPEALLGLQRILEGFTMVAESVRSFELGTL